MKPLADLSQRNAKEKQARARELAEAWYADHAQGYHYS